MKNKTFLLLFLTFVTPLSLADEPTSKEDQCEMYGSFQDNDGNWQTCDTDDITYQEESDS